MYSLYTYINIPVYVIIDIMPLAIASWHDLLGLEVPVQDTLASPFAR